MKKAKSLSAICLAALLVALTGCGSGGQGSESAAGGTTGEGELSGTFTVWDWDVK